MLPNSEHLGASFVGSTWCWQDSAGERGGVRSQLWGSTTRHSQVSQSWHIFAHGVMRLCPGPRCCFMQIGLPGVTPAPDMKWCQGSAQGLGFCSRDGVTCWMLSAVATIASGKLKMERIRKIRQTTINNMLFFIGRSCLLDPCKSSPAKQAFQSARPRFDERRPDQWPDGLPQKFLVLPHETSKTTNTHARMPSRFSVVACSCHDSPDHAAFILALWFKPAPSNAVMLGRFGCNAVHCQNLRAAHPWHSFHGRDPADLMVS